MAYVSYGTYRNRRMRRFKKPRTTRKRAPVRRRRTYRKRRMSTKSILNKTSRKKRNDMLTYSNTANDGTLQPTVSKQPLNVRANSTFVSFWCATAMDIKRGGGYNTIADVSARTSTTCYMRGLSENWRIQTSSGVPWFHRRICFTVTDAVFAVYRQASPLVSQTTFIDINGEGMQRMLENYAEGSDSMVAPFGYYTEVLFKGQRNTDWNDFITAKVDDKRVKVKYDRVRTITSGNSNGTVRNFKFWHPMNSNLTYDDDVTGEETGTSNYYAAETNQKMGNYMICDIIQPGAGGTATDLFRVSAEATLYWHEK